MKTPKRNTTLPIGRTARIAFELEGVRAGCCKAATALIRRHPLNEAELEECARLDDALARAQRLLKSAVRGIMMARLHRRSRAR